MNEKDKKLDKEIKEPIIKDETLSVRNDKSLIEEDEVKELAIQKKQAEIKEKFEKEIDEQARQRFINEYFKEHFKVSETTPKQEQVKEEKKEPEFNLIEEFED